MSENYSYVHCYSSWYSQTIPNILNCKFRGRYLIGLLSMLPHYALHLIYLLIVGLALEVKNLIYSSKGPLPTPTPPNTHTSRQIILTDNVLWKLLQIVTLETCMGFDRWTNTFFFKNSNLKWDSVDQICKSTLLLIPFHSTDCER